MIMILVFTITMIMILMIAIWIFTIAVNRFETLPFSHLLDCTRTQKAEWPPTRTGSWTSMLEAFFTQLQWRLSQRRRTACCTKCSPKRWEIFSPTPRAGYLLIAMEFFSGISLITSATAVFFFQQTSRGQNEPHWGASQCTSKIEKTFSN